MREACNKDLHGELVYPYMGRFLYQYSIFRFPKGYCVRRKKNKKQQKGPSGVNLVFGYAGKSLYREGYSRSRRKMEMWY